MNLVLKGLEKITEVYIDDIAIHSRSFDCHLQDLDFTLSALPRTRMTIKLKKCSFAKPQIDLLGHIVGSGCVRVVDSKVQAIVNMIEPTNKKLLKSFLAMCSYYRSFTPNMAQLALPLTQMTKELHPKNFTFNDDQRKSFLVLTEKLCSSEGLRAPVYDRPFIISTNVSDYAVGACLAQLNDEGVKAPIEYASQKLTEVQTRWACIEKETYAVIYALEKFAHIVYHSPINLFTDHNPLKYLVNFSPKSAKRTRWSLSLAKWDIVVHHRAGVLNGNADCLSRLLEH